MNQPQTFFIDCEFNSFKGELITMALVGLNGEELYCRVPIAAGYHPWVAENVIPVLEGPQALPSTMHLAYAISEFLEPYDAVHVVADWPEDIKYFMDALIIGPGVRVNTPALTLEVRRDLDAESAVPHNALHDARGIRDLYLSLIADA